MKIGMRLFRRKLSNGTFGNYYVEFDRGARRSLKTGDQDFKPGQNRPKWAHGAPTRHGNAPKTRPQQKNRKYVLKHPATAGIRFYQIVLFRWSTISAFLPLSDLPHRIRQKIPVSRVWPILSMLLLPCCSSLIQASLKGHRFFVPARKWPFHSAIPYQITG